MTRINVFQVLCVVLLSVFVTVAHAQKEGPDKYFSNSGEIIFSWADLGDEDLDGNIVRFSPWFNLQSYWNVDFSSDFGIFLGATIRNIGFIYENDTAQIKKKYRTYNFGIPVGLKLLNVDGSGVGIFMGYEIEFPFHYKEKTFINEDKQDDKLSIWFSDRPTTVNHSAMAGVQFPFGASLKFKYYFSNFFNKDFEEKDATTGATYKPYNGTDVNIFYVSLSFGLFRNTDYYYKELEEGAKAGLGLKK